jgi:hypothetical protein
MGVIVKKFALLFLVTSNALALSTPPGDFLQKAFIGGEVNGVGKIIDASVTCDSIEFSHEGGGRTSFPANSVDPIAGGNYVDFACINGGGCINRTSERYLNDITIMKLNAPGLIGSVVNAFKLHQKSCGGPVERPY